MAVGLYKYDGDINNRDSKLVLSENIATQEFYEEYWEKAIGQLGIKYIQDGAEFDYSQKDIESEELNLLLTWAKNNLQGKELEYMKSRVENLQKIIPEAFNDKESILYIF